MAAKPNLLPEKVITALYRKDYEKLRRLVNEDTVNLPDESGSTLLILAASAIEADAKVVKFLIDRGAEVNRPQARHGFTALHRAAEEVNREIVSVLLAAGADTNARDAGGETPLHHLVRAEDPRCRIAKALLEHGADPTLKDASHKAPAEVSLTSSLGPMLQEAARRAKTQKGSGKQAPAVARKPFLEHPTGDHETAVEAMADAVARLRALPEWDGWITFSAQGMGGRLDSYHFAKIDMRKEEIKPEGPPTLDLDLVARRARVSRSHLAKAGKGTYSVGKATPKQTARVLDTIFRQYLGIRPHTGEGNDYAVGVEW